MTTGPRIVPANDATWDDLQAISARAAIRRDAGARGSRWPLASRGRSLVAYLDPEPVGWCAVEPRTAYPRLLSNNRVPWEGRNEDKADAGVWAVTCFVTRTVGRPSAAS